MLETDDLNDPYTKIKDAINRHVESDDQFTKIKSCYTDLIKSPRRLNYAKSMSELFDLLERRNFLSKTNVDCLHALSSILKNDGFDTVLIAYKKNVSQNNRNEGRFQNKYAIARLDRLSLYEEECQKKKLDEIIEARHYEQQQQQSYQQVQQVRNNYDASVFDDVKKKMSYDLICTEIGKRWRELGRELLLREGELDNIEDKFRSNTKLKSCEVLRLFEERNDPRRIVLLLLDALENARRKDLRRNIEEILSR